MGEIVVRNIRRIMDEKKLTKYALEKKGTSKQLISAVLDHKNPTCNTIEKISNALGVHWSELIKE